MQNQEKQLLDLIAQVKKISAPNAKVSKIMQFLLAKTTSSHHEDCLIVEKILAYSDDDSDGSLPSLSPKQIAEIIVKSLKSIQSLSILLVLYAVWQKCRRTAHHDIDWKLEYERKRNEGFLASFNKWIQDTTYSDVILCNQVLSRVLAGLPNFLQFQKVRSTYLQFESCLIWLSLYTIKTRDDHLCALRAARLVKQVTDIRISDYEKKQHLILRKVVQLLGDNERRNNSLYLFFDRFTLRIEDIEYFINIREDFFQQLDERHMCNVFLALVQAGINSEILAFLKKVSALLKSNDQYFILRTLFEQVILPIVAAKLKTHRKLGAQIFDFVLFYIAGFLAHCFIGQDGLECILQNLTEVEDKNLRKKWAELSVLCCKEDPKLRSKAHKTMEIADIPKMNCDNLMAHINKYNMVWVVTMHNGRKLKKYPQIQSMRFRGIQNLDNQCYIISVVQALYCTDEFRKLIVQVHPEAKEKNLKVLKEFRQIFEGDLNVQIKDKKATVKYLKNLGPQQFRSTQRQEDSQQYLCKLFEYLEYELKKTKQGMKQFQAIFNAEFAIKIACKQCKVQRELKQHETQYVNTYSTKQHFQLKREEPLDQNYKCEKCGTKKKSVKITTLVNKPRILILHINRFRTTQKGVNKILGNYPIKRNIGDYHLVGFIVHKGSSINAGHYLYYARIEETRWALFNDSKVTQFNIAKEQEFEREFRGENSPYILFYKPRALVK